MLLSYFDCRNIVGNLREDGGVVLSTVERPDWRAVSGDFVIADGRVIAFYRVGDQLRLRVGHNETAIRAGVVRRTVVGRRATVTVMTAVGGTLSWGYDLSQIDPPLSLDLSPGAKQEDYDFGLFLASVCEDSARMARIYRVT